VSGHEFTRAVNGLIKGEIPCAAGRRAAKRSAQPDQQLFARSGRPHRPIERRTQFAVPEDKPKRANKQYKKEAVLRKKIDLVL
jgi:hypothetical protein